ncbi:MAG: hypothetical protein Q8N60_02500, partial [Candidatus Diapherotrites archaeon]|nr:hypothetical protein [Candidatus Diapherotrites archaeon]
MVKRPSDAKARFRPKPSDWGSGKTTHNWSADGMQRIAAGIRASAAERQKEREQRATQQIIASFNSGWSGFTP